MTTNIFRLSRTPKIVALPLILLVICNATSGCFNNSQFKSVISGKVTKVHDGDSIHVTPAGENRVIIRLAAIDAPEVRQAHGIQSRDHLRQLILNKQVTARCNKLDKYQRQVCVVVYGDEDINLKMLKAGLAWYYERFKDEQSRRDQINYRKAAKIAKAQQLGLWHDTTAIPPWEFRALQRN